MESHKIPAFIAVAILCTACWACTKSVAINPPAKPATGNSRDFEIKQAALKELPPPSATPLKQERSIKKAEGARFLNPSSLTADKDGNILIADNMAHELDFYSAKTNETTVVPTPAGEGALRFPFVVRKAQQKIYVTDDEGVKIFKETGQYEKLLRTHYSMWDFVVGNDGSIYANTAYRGAAATDGLIVKLTANGERVSSFGRRFNQSQYKGLDDQAFMACSWPLLFVAFKHRPLVAVYDLTNEKLVREFPIQHPVFSRLDELSKDTSFTNPTPSRVVLPRYVAGITVLDDRVFVLLHLPQVEIVELDVLGNEKNRFRSPEVGNVLNYFGFGIQNERGVRKFYVGGSGVAGEESPFLTQFAVATSD
jgi:hypothetical protein